jgi:hypothetical protein
VLLLLLSLLLLSLLWTAPPHSWPASNKPLSMNSMHSVQSQSELASSAAVRGQAASALMCDYNQCKLSCSGGQAASLPGTWTRRCSCRQCLHLRAHIHKHTQHILSFTVAHTVQSRCIDASKQLWRCLNGYS